MTQRIAIICHDVGGNALGRALVLADLVSPIPTRIVGFGTTVWPPAAGVPITVIPSPPTTLHLPTAARSLRRALRDDSILLSSKTRILSYGLAAVVADSRPHVLDIDDLEHVFVRRRLGWLRQAIEPDREPITRALERIPAAVGAISVASRALQRRFGGTWMPHVRDRREYASTAKALGPALRKQLGMEDRFVLGFVGTPRSHKGLDTAAAALQLLDPSTTLLIAGASQDDADVRALVERLGGRVRTTGPVALDQVPAVLGACDVVLVPQQPSIASSYQSPAKLLDALAAGSAVIASDIGDAREILGPAGVLVPPGDATALATAIADLRRDADRLEKLRAVAATWAATEFGLSHWRHKMQAVISGALERSRVRKG